MHGLLVRALPDPCRDWCRGLNMEDREKYWFPAKRFGWGWGPPSTWQGWAVLAGYIVAVAMIGAFFSPDQHPLIFPIGIAFATCLLIGICLKKGEPPGWRWGGKKQRPSDQA